MRRKTGVPSQCVMGGVGGAQRPNCRDRNSGATAGQVGWNHCHRERWPESVKGEGGPEQTCRTPPLKVWVQEEPAKRVPEEEKWAMRTCCQVADGPEGWSGSRRRAGKSGGAVTNDPTPDTSDHRHREQLGDLVGGSQIEHA